MPISDASEPHKADKPRRPREVVPPNALGYRPSEITDLLGIGKTSIFKLLKSGELRGVKLGRTRIITAESVKALLDRQAA